MKVSQRKTCVTVRSQGISDKGGGGFEVLRVQSNGGCEREVTRFSLRVERMGRIRRLEEGQ